MLLSEEYWTEFPDKKSGSEEVQIFLGRLQPIHNGHDAIINMMENPVVVLVKGNKSSKDKDKNPLSESYQTELIHKLNPNVKVVVAPTGYIPDIISTLRKRSMEVNEVLSGSDRIKSYQRQLNNANKKLASNKQFKIRFIETPRITSATEIRESIKSGDIETFKKLVPNKIHSEWNNLRTIIK